MREGRKLSKEEMLDYWQRVHRSWLERDPTNDLAPVISGGVKLCYRFNDYAHRLGMRNSLGYLNDHWGTFANRSVLDVGCGRGRWVREFAARGCQVTGVDISDEAVRLLAEKLPQHTFLAGDITDQAFRAETFDLVNSVTVLQHLPYDAQPVALKVISKSIKKGGYLLMLENCGPFSAGHVFPHPREEWVRMVETSGLKLRACWGSNFEILFRACFRLSMALLHGAVSHRAIQARVANAQLFSPPRPRAFGARQEVFSAPACIARWLSPLSPWNGFVIRCLSPNLPTWPSFFKKEHKVPWTDYPDKCTANFP